MIILPLGVGHAFTRKYFHSNLLIDCNGKRLLVDAGTTLRYSMDREQIEPGSIDYIFITHFHHDHVGGLAELFMRCRYKEMPHKPILLLRLSQLNTIDGMLAPLLNNQGLVWQDYCHLVVLHNDRYTMEDHLLQIIPTDNLHCEGLDSCGLKITDTRGVENIVITGDIKHVSKSNILSFIDNKTTAIIQDVSFRENPVHATYEEVLQYYPKKVLSKIWGIHYEDEVVPGDEYEIKLLRQGRVLNRD